jgi:replicative DNA helicase
MKPPPDRPHLQIVKRIEAPSVAGRVPPQDINAEAAVLSAALADPGALDAVLGVLQPEHFYSPANERIFAACIELHSAGKPVDLVMVSRLLRDRDMLAGVGGASYLAQISDATPTIAHVEAHAAIVREKWRARQLIATCQHIAAEGYGDVGDTEAWIDGAEQRVFAVAHTEQTGGLEHVSGALRRSMQAISDAAERGDKIIGTPTGFERLDAKTAGLHDGDLMIIAARPGMGKTALAMNIAVNLAHHDPLRERTRPRLEVDVFSLEMPREQLASRMICSEGRVDLGKLRQGGLQPEDWRRLTDAGAFLSSLALHIDDSPALSVLEIRAAVRRRQAAFNRPPTDTDPGQRVGLVVVDYLQLMKGSDRAESREGAVSEISRGLKHLAKELHVPVIALSQLNRSVETRNTKDKRPQLSDLRESGAIEQDADTVIFIYREEYYEPETKDAKGLAELIIAKQRNGPTGRVMTRFAPSCTRFDSLEYGAYPDMRDE